MAGATADAASGFRGRGSTAALPYLLLAPSILIVLAVLVYPLWDGLRASTKFYRYGKPYAMSVSTTTCGSGRTSSSSTRSG